VSEPLRIGSTLAIFAATLALVIIRPRGWNEAWWTILGAAMMLLFRLENFRQAWQTTFADSNIRSVLLFLFALLLFSALLERSGFFEWAAIRAAGLAEGDGRWLYRNVFLLGAFVTATLSLDTTAIILTPLVLAFVQRLDLPARPYIFACAFVANAASLPLPVSNLTNLLFAGAFHLSFGSFALHMLAPQAACLVANYFLFRAIFRRQLPEKFDVERLPKSSSAVKDKSYFLAAVTISGLVLLSYFAVPFLHIEPYVIALCGCACLGFWGIVRRQLNFALLRGIAWPIFPFVIGLFVVMRGIENLGISQVGIFWVSRIGANTLTAILTMAGGMAVAANAVNNIPSALLAIKVLQAAHVHRELLYAALLGTNIGPNVTLFGSLATILVLTISRKKGEEVTGLEFLKVGIIVTPVVIGTAVLALWADTAILQKFQR
jgi:arsenical pump membrane protein